MATESHSEFPRIVGSWSPSDGSDVSFEYSSSDKADWLLQSSAAQLAITLAHAGAGDIPLVINRVNQSEDGVLRLDERESKLFTIMQSVVSDLVEVIELRTDQVRGTKP